MALRSGEILRKEGFLYQFLCRNFPSQAYIKMFHLTLSIQFEKSLVYSIKHRMKQNPGFHCCITRMILEYKHAPAFCRSMTDATSYHQVITLINCCRDCFSILGRNFCFTQSKNCGCVSAKCNVTSLTAMIHDTTIQKLQRDIKQ